MAKHADYEKRTEELIIPILDELGFELYDVEYVKEGADYYLRAYIDKDGGITIDDCVEVSRKMNELLDAEPQIGGDEGYIFEVSSPGLGRVLKKDKHFEIDIVFCDIGIFKSRVCLSDKAYSPALPVQLTLKYTVKFASGETSLFQS